VLARAPVLVRVPVLVLGLAQVLVPELVLVWHRPGAGLTLAVKQLT